MAWHRAGSAACTSLVGMIHIIYEVRLSVAGTTITMGFLLRSNDARELRNVWTALTVFAIGMIFLSADAFSIRIHTSDVANDDEYPAIGTYASIEYAVTHSTTGRCGRADVHESTRTSKLVGSRYEIVYISKVDGSEVSQPARRASSDNPDASFSVTTDSTLTLSSDTWIPSARSSSGLSLSIIMEFGSIACSSLKPTAVPGAATCGVGGAVVTDLRDPGSIVRSGATSRTGSTLFDGNDNLPTMAAPTTRAAKNQSIHRLFGTVCDAAYRSSSEISCGCTDDVRSACMTLSSCCSLIALPPSALLALQRVAVVHRDLVSRAF